MILYSLESCAPCKQIKKLMDEQERVYQIETDPVNFPLGLKSVPALAVNDRLLTGGDIIVRFLKGE